MKPITPEEARLSFEFGFVCAGVDNHLGNTTFSEAAIDLNHAITQEQLDAVREKAIQLGVPVEEITFPAEVQESLKDPNFLFEFVAVMRNSGLLS